MEESHSNQGRRKTHIVVKDDGGNIGGLVIWGGALVVGSLIAAFAVKKRRKEAISGDKKNNHHKGGPKQGLGFILQTRSSTSHLNPGDKSYGSTNVVEPQVDSYAKDLILEDNPIPMINGESQDHFGHHQDPVDDSAKERIPVYDACGDTCEFSFPVLDASLLREVEKGMKQDSGKAFMERTQVIKEEKIVNDVKIIAQGMSIIHAVDAPNDSIGTNEIGKLEQEADVEMISPEETPLIHSVVEVEEGVDAKIATSSTNSVGSKEFGRDCVLVQKIEVEQEAAVAEPMIVEKIPTSQTRSDDESVNSKEDLAFLENVEVMEDGEIGDTSYTIAKNSTLLNSVGEGNDFSDGSPSKENIEVKEGKDLASDARVIVETASSLHPVGVKVDQEVVDVKADPGEDQELLETNDVSDDKVSLTCSVEEEEDENDGYIDHEEENGHENYTADEGEDSSEGTETSSAESNSAKIWSVESLNAPFLELKSGPNDLEDSAEKTMEDEAKSTGNSVSFDNSKNSNMKASKDDLQNWTLEKEVPRGLVVEHNRRAHLAKWRSRGLSISALLLLLLLLFAYHVVLFSDRLYRSLLVPSSSEN